MSEKGRKPKYLTVDRFEGFVNNDHKHLVEDVHSLTDKVRLNSKLLWIILGSLIALTLVERILGWATLVKGLLG